MPSFALNKHVVQTAEKLSFDFALSMIKLHGFGGKTEFWDHGLQSFTLMAGLASVTSRIKLYASTAVLTIPPAIVARMASTIDSISGGRFGVNIVSGWHEVEYTQMGLWPGEAHFSRRYDYSTEYVHIMKQLWETGLSDFKGEVFQMGNRKLSPPPSVPIKLVSAGQSDRGMEFAAQYCDFNFALGEGVNDATKAAGVPARMLDHAKKTGRDVGSYMLDMIIARETDAAAPGKIGPQQPRRRPRGAGPSARPRGGGCEHRGDLDGRRHPALALADQLRHGHAGRVLCLGCAHAGRGGGNARGEGHHADLR